MKKTTEEKTIKRKEYEMQSLSDTFVMPVRAKRGSIGYDLTVPEDFHVPAHARCRIPLRFAINLPFGVEAKIEPRSGLSLKGMEGYGTKCKRTKLFGYLPWLKVTTGKHYYDADVMVGKIDPNYTDEVNILLKNNDCAFTIKAGTRIAQMTFYNVGSPFFRLVDKLTCKSRGGGFNSSGTHRLTKPVKEKEEVVAEPAPHVSSEEDIKL